LFYKFFYTVLYGENHLCRLTEASETKSNVTCTTILRVKEQLCFYEEMLYLAHGVRYLQFKVNYVPRFWSIFALKRKIFLRKVEFQPFSTPHLHFLLAKFFNRIMRQKDSSPRCVKCQGRKVKLYGPGFLWREDRKVGNMM